MRLSISSIAFAAFVSAAHAASPSIRIDNTAYIGDDLGISCGKKGAKRVVQKKGIPVVFCFNVENTGDTHLSNLIMSNDKMSFFDNSVGFLAPGASKTITYQSNIDGDVQNTVTVTATPAHANKTAIAELTQVEAKDSSQVFDTEAAIARQRKLQFDTMDAFAAKNDQLDDCIQTKWDAKDLQGDLMCSKKDVYVENLMQFDEPKACIAGETIEITIEASIVILLDTTNDLGWFVDTSGGDAMEGSSCVINGLQQGNEYTLVDRDDQEEVVGQIAWGSNADIGGGAKAPGSGLDRKKKRRLQFDDDGFDDDADIGGDDFGGGDDDGGFGGNDDDSLGSGGGGLGDGDECGDVFKSSEQAAVINTPFIVKKTVLCKDEDSDGKLDVAVCFTWLHSDQRNAECAFNDNVPGGIFGGCYCSRYNIGNIYVVVPDNTTDVVC